MRWPWRERRERQVDVIIREPGKVTLPVSLRSGDDMTLHSEGVPVARLEFSDGTLVVVLLAPFVAAPAAHWFRWGEHVDRYGGEK